NANGVLDPTEAVRLPAVTVMVGGRTAQAATGGQVTVSNVPTGAQSATVTMTGLPPYFTPGAAVPVTVPQAAGTPLAIPATLATGGNRPNTYMAFGDSITSGTGSNDGTGYRSYLEADIRSYWGGNQRTINEGIEATRSFYGEQRMSAALAHD